MRRKDFTTRQKIIMFLLALVLVGILYYLLVYSNIVSSRAALEAEKAEIEASIEAEEMKATRMAVMKSFLDSNPEELSGTIQPYNNLSNELYELDNIMKFATAYSVSFEEAIATDTVVRRNINVTFEASSYDNAINIMQAIKSSKYRCLIKDVAISSASDNEGGLTDGGPVSVTMTVTFFETTEGAKDLSGLTYDQSQVTEETTDETTDGTEETVE